MRRPSPCQPLERTAASVALVLAASAAQAQPVQPCPPTSLEPSEGPPPRAWSVALQRLRVELTDTARPWACTGATVRVTADPAGKRVEVSWPGGAIQRRALRSPAELLATVEGLLLLGDPSLAEPMVETPAAPAPPTTETTEPPPVAEVPSPPDLRHAPRRDDEALPRSPGREAPARLALLDLVLDAGARVQGNGLSVSGAARATAWVHARRWLLGVWASYEPLAASLGRGPGVQSATFGLAAGWTVPHGRGLWELGATLGVGASSWSEPHRDQTREDSVLRTRPGLLLRWRSSARGSGFSVAVDGDLGFGALLRTEPTAPRGPRDPGRWSAGLSVGYSYGGVL